MEQVAETFSFYSRLQWQPAPSATVIHPTPQTYTKIITTQIKFLKLILFYFFKKTCITIFYMYLCQK